MKMKPLFKGLDTETQLLVALGSAVASGCIPCLENITGIARAEGIEEKKLKAAAIIGQFIKDQPTNNMKTTADQLLGTHLQSTPMQTSCPVESTETQSTKELEGSTYREPCGCS
jgi:AhpD family alkylhydroperoxidase